MEEGWKDMGSKEQLSIPSESTWSLQGDDATQSLNDTVGYNRCLKNTPSPSTEYHSYEDEDDSKIERIEIDEISDYDESSPEPFYTLDYERGDAELGMGGCGRVTKVHRIGSGTPLAVKRPNSTSKDQLRVHRREVDFYRKMEKKRPPWMPFYEGDGEYYGQPWLLFERLGHSLYKIFCESTLEWRKYNFHHYALGALACVQALHVEGYLHRDIKSDNFLTRPKTKRYLDESDPDIPGIVLIDYGFVVPILSARSIDKLRYPRFRGTPEMASRRQLLQLPIGPSDDLESLAYTLLEMYHGKEIWSSSSLISKPICSENGNFLLQKKNLNDEEKGRKSKQNPETLSMPILVEDSNKANNDTRPFKSYPRFEHTRLVPREATKRNKDIGKQENNFDRPELSSRSSGVNTLDYHQIGSQKMHHGKNKTDEIDIKKRSATSISFTKEDLCAIAENRDAEWRQLADQGFVPPFLVSWLKYCRSLKFTDWPNYQYLRSLLAPSDPANWNLHKPKTYDFIQDLGEKRKSHLEQKSANQCLKKISCKRKAPVDSAELFMILQKQRVMEE